jgi:predicted alpha/beta-hydrolase family hydrolase
VNALLLFPGAGSSAEHPSLKAIERRAPWPVTRADFPYRKAGRRAPDRPPVLLQAVVDEVAKLGADRLVLGGRSMGGRICSIAVAEKRVDAIGLVLISYPLHPPGRPEQLRVAHFADIDVPCLFVSGTRDAFGTPDELVAHTAGIGGRVTHVWFDGLGHDLKGADERLADTVSEWLTKLKPARRPSGPRG